MEDQQQPDEPSLKGSSSVTAGQSKQGAPPSQQKLLLKQLTLNNSLKQSITPNGGLPVHLRAPIQHRRRRDAEEDEEFESDEEEEEDDDGPSAAEQYGVKLKKDS